MITFLHPGSTSRLSGGTIYDLELITELRKMTTVDLIELPGSFPLKLEADGLYLQLMDHLAEVVIIDGLAGPLLPILPHSLFEDSIWIYLFHNPIQFGDQYSSEIQSQLIDLEMKALSRVDAVICTSQYSARYLETGPSLPLLIANPGKPRLKSNPRFRFPPQRLLSVGNLNHQKNVIAAIEALRSVSTPLTFDIVGPSLDVPYRTRLEQLIEHPDLKHHTITIYGSVEDINPFYEMADIFIHLPFSESYGMVLVEAMGHHLPIICSDVGGIPNTVEKAGLLVDPTESKQVASIVIRLCEDPDFYQEQVKASAERYDQIPSWEKTGTKVYQFIQLLQADPGV